MIPQIKSHGYEAESHVVETSDGYLLNVFRIPANKDGKLGKQPIFLQHGILASCSDWIDLGAQSLAYLLADEGYDVWIGNARGNTYSRKHRTFSEKEPKFWDFSFHEMGLYDIPAVVKHIKKVAKVDKELLYIGHSMGTTIFFVFSTLLPNIAKNFKAMIALAPVAYLKNVKSPIKYLAPFSTEVELLTSVMGLNEFFPKNSIYKYLCYDSNMMNLNKRICEQVMYSLSGFNKDHYDDKILPAILSNRPAGTSTKTVLHYAQIIKNRGVFSFYDYGVYENKKKYEKSTPPLYQIENIKVPMLLMYSQSDWLATPKDVRLLTRKLSNSFDVFEVPLGSFTHVDFLWSKSSVDLVYKPLLKYLHKFSIK